MARMFPSRPDPDTPDGEREVFHRFEKDLPDSWNVIHARRFFLPKSSRGNAREGEVDFLVLDPERGYLGLEIKGGPEIGRDRDGWYSVNKGGRRNTIKDPGQQAQRSVHSIDIYLRDRPAFRQHRLSFGWGVVFPEANVPPDLDPALPRELVIDRSDMTNVEKCIHRVFSAAGVTPTKIAPAQLKAFVSELAPTVRLTTSLADRIDTDTPALIRLTQEQSDLLEQLSSINRLAIRGTAGTGKTMLAMEKARSLASEGKRVLLLCYNAPLAQFLAQSAEGFTVFNFHSYCRKIVVSAGLRWEPPKEADAAEKFWAEDAPNLLMEALDAYPDERYDGVLIDEGQDFKEYWWLAIDKLLAGQKDNVLYVFYDPNQALYGGNLTDTLGLGIFNLKYNCRNTGNIAAYFGDLIDAEVNLKPGAPEGVEVIQETCAGQPEMVHSVRKLLHRFHVEEGIPTDKIVILSPHILQRSALGKSPKLGNLTVVDKTGQLGPAQVRFSTIGRFKGLEADVVVHCEIRPGDRGSDSSHLYVASSRARHVLAICRYAE